MSLASPSTPDGILVECAATGLILGLLGGLLVGSAVGRIGWGTAIGGGVGLLGGGLVGVSAASAVGATNAAIQSSSASPLGQATSAANSLLQQGLGG